MIPWMLLAKSHLGEGSINHEYFSHTNYGIPPDGQHIPWCAAFACSMLEESGYKSPHSAAAKDFIGYGVKKPFPESNIYGAVVVFEWPDKSHHVTFIEDWTPTTVTCLGGNQHNLVSESVYKLKWVTWIGWPVK